MVAVVEPLTDFLTSCRYALRGLRFAARSQRNFRLHLLAAAAVLAAGLSLRVSPLEFSVLLTMISLVILGELFNTALEMILNLMEARDHPVARAAKDVAAASVLMAAAGSALVGLVILGPPLLRRLAP